MTLYVNDEGLEVTKEQAEEIIKGLASKFIKVFDEDGVEAEINVNLEEGLCG